MRPLCVVNRVAPGYDAAMPTNEPDQTPPALRANTAKSAELQVMIWFLEVGWEVFTPVADTNATDLVVRVPADNALVSVQIKHKQPGAKNEGMLLNPWHGSQPPFDYLVFYQPSKSRGLIVPKHKLKKKGKMFLFFKGDSDGYSTGEVRPLFREFAFDFAPVPHERRARAFSDHLLSVHQTARLYTATE